MAMAGCFGDVINQSVGASFCREDWLYMLCMSLLGVVFNSFHYVGVGKVVGCRQLWIRMVCAEHGTHSSLDRKSPINSLIDLRTSPVLFNVL